MKGVEPPSRVKFAVPAACYALALVALVFTPIGWKLNRFTVLLYSIWNFDLHLPHLPPSAFGMLLNVILFIPTGWLVAIGFRASTTRTLLFTIGISSAIEIVQLIPALQRQASLNDVFSNTLGGLLGAFLVRRTRFGRPICQDATPALIRPGDPMGPASTRQ